MLHSNAFYAMGTAPLYRFLVRCLCESLLAFRDWIALVKA